MKLSVFVVNDRFVTGGVSTILGMLMRRMLVLGMLMNLWVNERPKAVDQAFETHRIGFGLEGFRLFLSIVSCAFPGKLVFCILRRRMTGHKVVIHLNTPYLPTAISAMAAALLTQQHLIYTVHANRSHLGRFYQEFEKLIAMVSNTIVFELSASIRDYSSSPRLANKSVFIPFGVAPENARLEWMPRRATNFKFVAVNRLEKNRMTEFFLKAFQLISGDGALELLIVGSGSELGPLRAMAREMNIADQVEFQESVQEVLIQKILLDADCFLTLSAQGDVGMAGKIAAGICMPMLAYEFDHGDEAFYSAVSFADLAAKMRRMAFSEPEELIRVAKATKELIYTSSEDMLRSYQDLYESCE